MQTELTRKDYAATAAASSAAAAYNHNNLGPVRLHASSIHLLCFYYGLLFYVCSWDVRYGNKIKL